MCLFEFCCNFLSGFLPHSILKYAVIHVQGCMPVVVQMAGGAPPFSEVDDVVIRNTPAPSLLVLRMCQDQHGWVEGAVWEGMWEGGLTLLHQGTDHPTHEPHPFIQEADGRILQALLEKEDELQQVEVARRAQARADAAWMKQVIEEQLQLEKAREAELQQLLR